MEAGMLPRSRNYLTTVAPELQVFRPAQGERNRKTVRS